MNPKNSRLIIIGGGNSISEGINSGLWDALSTECTFGINSLIYFFKPTIPFWGDWYFYKKNKEELDKYPLVIGMFDGKIGNGKNFKCPKGSNLLMLPTSSEYYGENSWEKGFYSRNLTGLFSLTVGIALGFKKIYLLGMDFCEVNGKTHFYQKDSFEKQEIGKIIKPGGTVVCGIGKDDRGFYRTGTYNKPASELYNKFKKVNENVKIFNVSPESKIDIFPKITYKEFFKTLKEEPKQVLQYKASLEIENLIEKYRKPFL